jgi:hypothetical protein
MKKLLRIFCYRGCLSSDPIQVSNYTQYSRETSKTDHLWRHRRLEPLYRWAHPSSRESLTRCQHWVNLILHASLKETPERFLSNFHIPSIIVRGFQQGCTNQPHKISLPPRQLCALTLLFQSDWPNISLSSLSSLLSCCAFRVSS